MTGHVSGSQIREHIWLVALYEYEARAAELLERLSAIGIDTSEATTVRVEIDDQLRAARFKPISSSSTLSPQARSAVTGALIGGAIAMAGGILLYAIGLLTFQIIEGLFNHALVFVIFGAAIGAIIGIIFASAKQRKLSPTPLPKIQQLRSEGFLVAVKMPPLFAERAEEIARSLGAKEILL